MQNRKRNNQIIVRLSDDELADLNQKLEQSGMTKTEFFIKASSNQNIIIINDLQEICIELKKQGINLNQALKFAYETGDIASVQNTIADCNNLFEKLQQLCISTDSKVSRSRRRKARL